METPFLLKVLEERVAKLKAALDNQLDACEREL